MYVPYNIGSTYNGLVLVMEFSSLSQSQISWYTVIKSAVYLYVELDQCYDN